MSPVFEKDFDPRYGEAVALSERVARITARNPSALTFHGTVTYLVGDRTLVLIDPGPDDPAHRDALLKAIDSRPVAAILATHRHRDHVDGAAALKKALQAPILAAAPVPRPGGAAGRENGFAPDRLLADGERIEVEGATLEVLTTPGHAADHAAFALLEENVLFSGDHVMGWSTTVVAPPDGHMGLYLDSLRRLLLRPERVYHPGHGGSMANGHGFARALLSHRLAREEAVARRLAAGDETIEAIVERLYPEIPSSLKGAAGLSVLAHLEHLIERGEAAAEPGLALKARFHPKI